MKSIATCLLALWSLLAVRAPATEAPGLARAMEAYDRATVQGDVATLERLFADDYVLVNSDASVEDKRRAIADFLMPGFSIDPYVMEQPVRIAWREGAVVSGVVHLRWTQDGRHQARVLRIAHVWAKRNGRWRMTYTQVTRVPQSSSRRAGTMTSGILATAH